MSPSKFGVWVSACPHVFRDLYTGRDLESAVLREDARESLGDPIVQSEADDSFGWDVGLCLGDFAANQGIPIAEEGEVVAEQLRRGRKHVREQIYCVCGNHDASPDNIWFRTWVDPAGEHPEKSGVDSASRPYPIDGTWERYSFGAGNLLFLMMSDRNDYEPPVGRIIDGVGYGGRPAGAVTLETFEWWKAQVRANPDKIIISTHHHMLKDTTIGSGEYEGFGPKSKAPVKTGEPHFHGYFPDDGDHNKGAGYIYWVVDESTDPYRKIPDAQAFENYLSENQNNDTGAMDLWIGGHTHAYPDATKNGRTTTARKWGVNFLNCAPLTMHHAGGNSTPSSRLLVFTEGSDEVKVRCYLHTSNYAPQGWYDKVETTMKLRHPFVMP